MIFVTFNLNEFRKKIKLLGYSIHGGCKTLRDEVNAMNNLLSLIDLEFRDSLYKNYCYHKNNEDGRYSFNYTLKRSHFNFQNIHCRLGGVRYTHNISNRNKDKLTSNTMDCKTNYLSLMKKFKHIINKFLNSIKYYNNLINWRIKILKDKNLEIVLYKNKDFLNPLLNIENKLLAPLVYDDNIYNRINDINLLLDSLPNSSLVKVWIRNEIERSKIIICAKNIDKINPIINKRIDKAKILAENRIKDFFLQFIELKENNLNNDLFKFNKLRVDEILENENKKSPLYAGCYIITFSNKNYFYIGSTTNFKTRFKTHTKNINDYINIKNNSPNKLFKWFLFLEKSYYFMDKGELKDCIKYDFNIMYLSPNYLNQFKNTYSNYILNEKEEILLDLLTDFNIKFLEGSLITHFKPTLNIIEKIVFKSLKNKI